MKKIVLFVLIAVLMQISVQIDAFASEDPVGAINDTDVVNTRPVILRAFPPQYPKKARQDCLHGFVTLKFLVTKNGEITNVSVAESAPENVFDAYAIAALKRYKFDPATKNGKSVDCIVNLPIIFTLDESKSRPDSSDEMNAYRFLKSGEKMIAEEDYREAVDEITKAIELYPGYSAAYYYRALAYYKNDDYQEALESIGRAIKLEGKVSLSLNLRAEIYCQQKEYKKAIKNYTKAIKFDSENAYYYVRRGESYGEMGEYQKALQDFTDALNLDETQVQAYNSRGSVYYKLNDYESACGDYEKACELGQCDELQASQQAGVCTR